MTGQTIGAAVAKQTEQPSPSALIANNRGDLAQVMPTHVRADTFVRIAQGVVRRDPKLAEAAHQSPQTLMVALMESARLGLEPGTEQFYLTPRKNKGRPEVLGIPGYQGYIELMYRSGAVASVVVEAVRSGDRFSYRPGRDTVPEHDVDWFGDRGELQGVYAYAVMTNGATSKVVVLNEQHIETAKKSAQGANSEYSPWKTNPEAMWMKTAARRLAKWVPTSTEDRRVVTAASERADQAAVEVEPDPLDITEHTVEADGDAIEGEIVEDGGQQ